MSEPEFVFLPVTVHALVDVEVEDKTHEVVLVDNRTYEVALTSPECDFCSDSRVRWQYECREFSIPELTFGSDDGWVACDACSTLIEARDRDGLVARAIRSWTVRLGAPPEAVQSSIRRIQWGFFENMLQSGRQAFG